MLKKYSEQLTVMIVIKYYILVGLLLVGCVKKQPSPPAENTRHKIEEEGGMKAPTWEKGDYSLFIREAANSYGIDEKLIKAIIQVESGGNPYAVSRSNAIGLMQIKASAAGRDVYRYKGRYGQPTVPELKDPAMNIDLGATYLNILQNQQLVGITDPLTMRYAIIVSYVNGAGAMLRIFSTDKKMAIKKINRMTPAQFYQYIQEKHPELQGPRYLWKVNNAYQALLNEMPSFEEKFQIGQVDVPKIDSATF